MTPDQLSGPIVIVCEGSSDCAFFNELKKPTERNISGIQLAFPNHEETPTGGRNGFSAVLGALKGKRGFDQLRLVLLVSDNDDNPADSLSKVKDQIRDAGDYGIPVDELVPAPALTAGFPATMIMMLPLHKTKGQLEDLCLIAAYNQRADIVPYLGNYCLNVVKPSWSANRASKAILRMLFASHYGRPNTGMPYCWSGDSKPDLPGALIPVSDTVFDEIADKLRTLVATYPP